MKITVHSDVNVLYTELHEGEQARTLEVKVLKARAFLSDFLARGGQPNVPNTTVLEQFEPGSIYALTPNTA